MNQETLNKIIANAGIGKLGPNGTLEGVTPTLTVVTGTDPDAGNEISETVPQNQVWLLIGFRATLSTDTTVATRKPILRLTDDNSVVFADIVHNQTVAASSNGDFNWWANFNVSITNGRYKMNPLPYPVVLFPGWTLETITVSKQAGDNWLAPSMYVVRWK